MGFTTYESIMQSVLEINDEILELFELAMNDK
jgi:hypothetical protein